MKKNLALFMAAMMAMTAVPVTSVFAAPEVSISVADYYAKEQDTAYDGSADDEEISYYLDIVLDRDILRGSQFTAELTGAKFTNLDGGSNIYSVFDDGEEGGDDDASIVHFKDGSEYSGDTYKINDYTDDENVDIVEPGTVEKGSQQTAYANIAGEYNEDKATVNTAIKRANDKLEALALKDEKIAVGLVGTDPESVRDDLQVMINAVKDAMGEKSELGASITDKDSLSKLDLTVLEDILGILQGLLDEIEDTLDEMNDLKIEMESMYSKDSSLTSAASTSAVFSNFANAGVDTKGRVIWTNLEGLDSMIDSTNDRAAYEATVLLKKTGDRTMRATFVKPVSVNEKNASDAGKYTDSEVTVRLPLPITIDADAESVEIAITDSSGGIPVKSFLVVDTASAGTVTTSDGIAKGREIINLKTIFIKEATTGVLDDGAFELIAPDGYRFRNKIEDIGLKASGDASFAIVGHDTDVNTPALPFVKNKNVEWTDDDDNTSLAIALDVKTKSSRLPGTVEVSGLIIEPIDDDSIVDGEELFMTIRDFEEDIEDTQLDNTTVVLNDDKDGTKGIGVDTEDFKVADSVDWGVTLTAASVKDLTAGRWAKDADDAVHATAEITIEETENDTWRGTRTTEFTLPEGVEIRGVNIKSVDGFLKTGVSTNTDASIRDNTFKLGNGNIANTVGDLGMDSEFQVVTDTAFKDSIVSIDENVMTWKNIDNLDDDNVSKVTFVLYLSIAPTYAEDTIALQLGGTAIDDEIDPVTIANVKHPITVTTKPTDVQIGYQRFTVADIVIEENFAGAILEADSGLVISMDADKAKGLELVDVGEVTVEGDIRISDVSTATNQLSFDVIRASSKTPSTITLSDVEVYVDRTVPYGTYSVEVGGESVFANVEGGAFDNDDDDDKVAKESYELAHNDEWDKADDPAKFARFSDGYKQTYINLATEGSNTPLKDHVVISAGSATALVDGKEVTMTDVVPYRTDAEGNSFMVPVRFASEIFGVKSENLLWDNASKTATILLDGGRIIQFVGGTDYYTVNGAKVQMLTGTTPVYTEIDPAAERMYVPFRHLGRAFGIADADITYDEATETAQYNQPRE